MAREAEQVRYQIKIQGELDAAWTEYFEGLAITYDSCGNTVLTGPIVDHTALHSILLKIRDLNLKLVSVNQIDTGPEDVTFSTS
jgi:hypothetical protein